MKKAFMTIGEIEIIGNNHDIPLVYWYELTESEKKDCDYIELPDDNFTGFRYKGNVYDLGEFMRVDKNNPFYGHFDGHMSDSFFSGILVKFTDDSDFIKAFWYYS